MSTPLQLPTGKAARLTAAAGTILASLPFLASVAFAGNLLQYSEEFDKWTMVRGTKVSPNAYPAPNGTQTADSLIDSPSINGARVAANTVTATDGGVYTFSVYLKAGSLTKAVLATRNGPTGDHSGLKFITLTNTWQRYHVTTASLKPGKPITAEIHPGDYDREKGNIYAWGAQLEPGNTPTEYQKTPLSTPPPTDTTAPAAPAGLSAQAGTSVQLTWNANTEADLAGYRVYRAMAGSTSFSQIGTPTTPGLNDANVTAGSSYTYRVTAVDKTGNESAPANVSATVPVPDTTPPAVPAGLSAQAGKPVQLAWTANSETDLAGYRVYRAASGSSTFAVIGAPSTAAHADSNVTPGLAYSYRVTALDKTGNESASSNVVSAAIPVDAPSGLSAIVAPGQVELQWTAPAGSIAGYRVERAVDGSTAFAQIAAPNATSHVDTAVSGGNTYTYRVIAVGTAGHASVPSASVTVPVPDVIPPAAPAGLVAAAGKPVQLNWTANSEPDLAGYRVYRAESGSSSFAPLAETTSPSHSDNNVTPGLAYSYRVTAFDRSDNESTPSATASATIPVESPSGLTASLVDGKVALQWTAPAGSIAGYRVERAVDASTSFAQIAAPATTSYLDGNVETGKTYTYRVKAVGTAGNESPASATASVSIPTPPPPADGGSESNGVNLIHYSEEFEKWTPIRSPKVSPDLATAPDGQPTADHLYDNSARDGARIDANTITSEGSEYTYSVYLKAGSVNTAVLCVRNGPNGNHSAFKQVTLSDQWQRFAVTTPVIPAGGPMTPEIHAGRYDKDTGFIMVWGAQYEKGSVPTTYQKTPGGTTTPPADTTPPATPTGLSASVATGVKLTWNANTEGDLLGYRVYRATTENGTYNQVGNPTESNLTDGNVSEGGTYWYKVAAEDKTGNVSPLSSAVSATVPTTSVTVPAPTGLTASLANNEITLAWTGSTGIASYRVERGINSTVSLNTLGEATTTKYVDGLISGGNSYSYRVRAIDANGNVSDPSNVVTVSVPLPPPPTSAGALNVRDYGANPAKDGDDRAAIQACLNAAISQGKDVYFPAGYYWLSSRVYFLKGNNVAIFGDGMTKSIIAGNTDRDSLLQIERCNGVTVRDLRFEGSLTNEQNTNVWPAIEPFLSSGTTVRRVHTYGTGYLVRDNSATDTLIEDAVCEDYGRIGYLVGSGGTVRNTKFVCRPSWVFADQMNGIYASAGKQNILIENNQFIHCGSYAMTLWGSNSGVWTENVTVQHNLFERCDRALVIAASASGPGYRNVKFLNNTVRQCADKSIHIGKFNGSNADGTALVIDGNVFEDPGSDMAIFLTNWNASGPITGVRITNNEFRQPTKSAYYGLYLWQNSAAFSDILVENNTISDIGHNGTTEKAHCGIYLRSGTVTIRGNTLSHWQYAGYGMTVDALRIDSGATNCVITNNTFNGTGAPGCYGARMTSSGSSTNGSITNSLFRKAKLNPNGIPTSGNVIE